MKSFEEFECLLLLMGWQAIPHDGIGVKDKWENKGNILTRRQYVNPAFVLYNSGEKILGLLASSVEFNNIHEVINYLEGSHSDVCKNANQERIR